MPIHPTAVVDVRAEIGPEVEIGPYAVIEGPVRLGRGTRVLTHGVVRGHTRLGAENVVHPGAVIGGEPQDVSYDGAESYVEIGDRNVFREGVYIHRGTRPGSATVIGSDCYFMGNSHAAHNCRVGDRVTLANGAVLGGHAEIGDGVFLGGNCAVHQYVRVGTLAILRGLSRTSRDVPPFCVMDWTSVVRGVNRVGLQRAGFSPDRIRAVRRAFALLFARRRNLRVAVAEVEAQQPNDDVRLLLDFIAASKRGVSRGPRAGAEED